MYKIYLNFLTMKNKKEDNQLDIYLTNITQSKTDRYHPWKGAPTATYPGL